MVWDSTLRKVGGGLAFTESKPFIDFMGRLGVLFLLFYLGLGFSVNRLIKSGKAIVTGGTIYVL
jgi:CPA2 family monovalent cation:H+ antiporter-2